MIGDGIDKVYSEVENPIINYYATKSGKYEAIRNDGGIVSTIYGNYVLIIFIKNFKDKNYLMRKRVMQNAALSVALMKILDTKGIPTDKCVIPSNLPQYAINEKGDATNE